MRRGFPMSTEGRCALRVTVSLRRRVPVAAIPPRACIFHVICRQASIARRCHTPCAGGSLVEAGHGGGASGGLLWTRVAGSAPTLSYTRCRTLAGRNRTNKGRAKPMAVVELRGLTKRYGSNTVVDRLDLTIGHGELVCLLGPSGCGKTTTLRLVAGFLEPDGGEIHVGGRRLSAPGSAVPPEQRAMSMIFQSYALWPHMTIAENVAYGLTVRGTSKDETRRRVDKILVVTQMAQFAARYPNELSGGQQQRVALARALVVQPETLLLDEPLSNLDANLREEMRFEVRRLHDEYKYTTLYVTHDQVEAMTTADRIVVMNGGRGEQA